MSQKTYIVERPFAQHAKGDEVTLNPRQAQFLEASGQIKPKPEAKPVKAVRGGGK